jgi:hypothetical protein
MLCFLHVLQVGRVDSTLKRIGYFFPVAQEMNTSDSYRHNVDVLKHEIDELERLTRDETTDMGRIMSKADSVLCAQKAVTVVAASISETASGHVRQGAAYQAQPSRRPVPPQEALGAAQAHQRLARPTPNAVTSRAEREKAMTTALAAEGWDVAHVRAALVATQGASLDAARGWLSSIPKSAATTISTNVSRVPDVAAAATPGAVGSALNAARRNTTSTHLLNQSKSTVTVKSSPQRVARGETKDATQYILKQASQGNTSPKKIPSEVTLSAPSPHKVSASAGSECFSAREETTSIMRSTIVAGPVSARHSPPARKETAAIQVRDANGKLHTLSKVFHETDPLNAIALEYFRLYPMHPSPRLSCEVRIVVPWLRRAYSHEQLATVTLKQASLCPTATVVLQIAKYAIH